MSHHIAGHPSGWIAASLVLLAACSGEPAVPATPALTATPSSSPSLVGSPIDLSLLTGRIMFAADPGPGMDVYVINADGSGLIRLTKDPAADFDPSWSPDGRRIVYRHQTEDDLTAEIYVMKAEGSNPHRLTHNDVPDWGPAWSPDGRRIAFNSDPEGVGRLRGFVMRPDGSQIERIDADVWVEYPAWSPDGRRIAFMAQTPEGTENYEIHVMDADGSNLRRLTDSPGPDGWPTWSPDGKLIAFSSVRDDCVYSPEADCKSTGDIGPYHTLYVMNADGSGERRLSDAFAQIADWSPDGRYLVFEAMQGLHVIRADGSGLTLIPTAAGAALFPDWTT